MHIEELVLEGFKSYPIRTQITGWDPSFNAITGLNGSGKSNILDAICFVLGITNMAQMRASNQQDLIYKRGQAGITKASVTIVFDNSDKSTSPPGLEAHKQITVTRQIAMPNVSKYLLNGHKAPQQTILTMFQSVQLNINNPNFVIMQGRITKVLNMRPQEILGMVEEAAGTRMFEDRKDKAKKTMAKKDKRVQEILSLLAEEITPKLEGLRKQKREYLAYQKSCTELERIGRVLRAWEWWDAKDREQRKEAEVERAEHGVKELEGKRKRATKECETAEKQQGEVIKRREAEVSKDGKLKKLEEEASALGKVVVKLKTQAEIKEGTIKDEKGNLTKKESEIQELESLLEEKQAQVAKIDSSYQKVKNEHTAAQTKLSTAEELLQTLLTGLSSNSKAHPSGGGYMGQIAQAKSRIAQAQAEEQQLHVKLKMAKTELQTLEGRWSQVEREAAEGKGKLERLERDIEECRKKVEKSGWSQERESEVEEKIRQSRASVRTLSEEYEHVKQNLGRLNFEYSDPRPGFDRRKVKGLAATLISLDEKHYDKATALEIAAGAKLFNVIVEDEKVGKDLLAHGQLKKRVTLIPLNKISARALSDAKWGIAQKLAPGKVHKALSLVGYAQDLAPAIAYVFSDNLICADAEAAKRVTFSPEVGVRSVTIEGDVYDPSGTLSGGSAPSGSGILVKAQEMLEVGAKLEEARRKVRDVEAEEERSRKVREGWRQLKGQLEMREHEMELMRQQVQGSNAAMIGAQIEKLKTSINELTEAIQAAKQKQTDAKEECKKLERDMEEFKNNKEGKTEQIKADILKQKAALQQHAVALKTQQKEVQTASLELQQMQEDTEKAKESLEESKVGLAKLHKELVKLQEQVATSEAEHAEVEEQLYEERARLTRFDNELKELANVIKEKKQVVLQAELDIQQMQHEIQVLNKDKQAAVNSAANLEKQHDWISETKDQFGKPGTQYDFVNIDIQRHKEKARELEESQKGMKKKGINQKVLNMIDNVEKREVELQKMLATVMKDKEKIEETIEELDRYKRDALQKTWEKVDRDFGGIFAELLPGNFAKLQPPDGLDLMDGLEVKVRLGSVWKQSLTELSGGQRSLIALSLIMALLQFKPAPMYILDEIDAALDLSHTQHIGQLFRTRFRGSQFIVVSLKEGLFTNANVLFRARFRDGTSIVERTAQRSGSALYNGRDDGEGGEGEGRRARGRIQSG